MLHCMAHASCMYASHCTYSRAKGSQRDRCLLTSLKGMERVKTETRDVHLRHRGPHVHIHVDDCRPEVEHMCSSVEQQVELGHQQSIGIRQIPLAI